MSNPLTRQWPADSHINSSVPMWTSKVMSHSLSQSQHGDSRENDKKGYFENVTKCPFKQGGGSSTWMLCLVNCIEASRPWRGKPLLQQQFWNRLLKVNDRPQSPIHLLSVCLNWAVYGFTQGEEAAKATGAGRDAMLCNALTRKEVVCARQWPHGHRQHRRTSAVAA